MSGNYFIYNDTSVVEGTLYYYKVVISDTNGMRSEPSGEISGRAGPKLKIKNAFCNIQEGGTGWLWKPGKPTIMLAGHCDEVGFMVKYIDEKWISLLCPHRGY
jgi:hypothetical protein